MNLFNGILCPVDKPSNKPPHGAQGHKVRISAAAAVEALPTLIGKPVNASPRFNDHDYGRVIGEVTNAWLDNGEIRVCGQVQPFSDSGEFGMSYEAHGDIENIWDEIWTLTRFRFTGASVLFRRYAAYTTSRFELCR
jgi:hypothetical protein